MKAKKSSPKSIRFNIEDFAKAMEKGGFESAQDMVDFILKKYVEGKSDVIIEKPKAINTAKVKTEPQQELSKAEEFKLIREGKI